MTNNFSDIAIIGIAGKYPKSHSPKKLWQNILNQTDLSSSNEQMGDKTYVNRYFALDKVGFFDNKLFAFTPLEASLTDPQHRMLLTCSYLALMDAGCPKEPHNQKFGVFATTSISSYLLNVLMQSEHYKTGEISYPILIGNDKDFLATRIAYKLNLSGPALTVQCGCSSSLVAVHYACQSLLMGECDLTVVGGVSLSVPQEMGYYYQEGGILSSDGTCRPFDEHSSGTIKGNGCSVIILKRLANAINDQNKIYGIIKGIAINNDGNRKVGFTAPSIVGQKAVIQEALSMSSLAPDEIDYIETHGTGTKLGDLIELTALSKVFQTKRKIPLGSLKANIGHLDVASGISSLIKLIYVLNECIVPPIHHFKSLNHELHEFRDLFHFPTEPMVQSIENASVSSFGIGGTNAHAIISRYDKDQDLDRPRSQFAPLDEKEFWVHIEDDRLKKQTISVPIPIKDVLVQVIEIWTRSIGETIQASSNFVDLGGDSLIALEIVDIVNKRFDMDLNLTSFQHLLTPTKMAQWIQDRVELSKHPHCKVQDFQLDQARYSAEQSLSEHVNARCLVESERKTKDRKMEVFNDHDRLGDGLSLFVPIKTFDQNRRSVFLIHPAGGTTFCYHLLNRFLKGNYNVLVVDLSDTYSNYHSMEELGSFYLKEMKKIQPHGPYFLGGYSFGGNLSYEMAVQLTEQNEEVSKILMFDSHLPEAYHLESEISIDYRCVFSKIADYFSQKSQLSTEAFNFFFKKWVFCHQLLNRHHQTKRAFCNLTLFATEEPENVTILDNLRIKNINKVRWVDRFSGIFKMIPVKGNHYTMFNMDLVVDLGRCFDEELL